MALDKLLCLNCSNPIFRDFSHFFGRIVAILISRFAAGFAVQLPLPGRHLRFKAAPKDASISLIIHRVGKVRSNRVEMFPKLMGF